VGPARGARRVLGVCDARQEVWCNHCAVVI
jgi:hypothetical protein